MSKVIYHTHHIIPKHMGGSDDPSNLVKLTIEEHAQAHLELYEKYGDKRDLLAHKTLLGQITRAEAIKIIQKLPKTEQHKKKIGNAVRGNKNGMYGKKQSAKQKEAVRVANSVLKPHISNNMKKLHAEGKTYKFSKKDCGARAVIADGVKYESVSECAKHYGWYHNAVTYRIKSDKWVDWRYL